MIQVANLICHCCQIPIGESLNGVTTHSTEQSKNTQPTAIFAPKNFVSGANFLEFGQDNHYRLAVVVSAMAGVTDALQASCNAAAGEFNRHHADSNGRIEYTVLLEEIRSRHIHTVDELVSKGEFHRKDAG